eukprot:g6079.t1
MLTMEPSDDVEWDYDSVSQAVPGSGTADTQPVLEAQSSSTVDIGGNADDALDSDQDMDTSLEDKSVENHGSFRFKSSKSNMELFANSKKQEVSAKKGGKKKKGGVLGLVKKHATKAIQKKTTKLANKHGLIYRFYPEEKVYAVNEEKAKKVAKAMKERNEKRAKQFQADNEAWLKKAMKSVGGYSWGDKVLCGSCEIVLETAWHNMKDIDPKDEDDAYNAIGDVCSEHISIAEEACKKIEEESATASKLLLTSEDISKVCVEINLCEPRTMSTYH